jgi:hypothetical protein
MGETDRVMTPDRARSSAGVITKAGNTPVFKNFSSGRTHPFRWSPDAVRHLYEDVEWALTFNPTGAAAIAGVLLGKSDSTIEIMDCQPVFLMQEQDHAYALGGPGRREFERTMAACRSRLEGEGSVIGYYRSHIGDGLDLTEEDLGLVRACFGDSSAVLVLMKLTGDGSSTVRVFSGGEGEFLSEFRSSEDESGMPRWLELWQSLSDSPPEAPGPEDTAKTVEATEIARAAEPVHMARPEFPVLPEEVDENSVIVERRSPRRTAFLLGLAITLLLALVLLVFNGPASLKPWSGSYGSDALEAQVSGSRYPALAMRVERQGDDLRLDWDRTAPVLGAATGGMLTIREGNGPEKQVLLDVNLLRTGAVIYRPVHGDMFLRLVIFGPNGRNIGESVATYPQRASVSRSHPYKESQ